MRIIGFFGHSGAGKDTLAMSMISFGVDAKVYKFAEPLKKMAACFLDASYEDVAGVSSESRSFVNSNNSKLIALTGGKLSTPRELMQWLGTDVFRNQMDSDIWTKHLLHRMDEDSDVFITDGRFTNTFDSIKKWGGDCVLVTRKGVTGTGHASEIVPYSPRDYDYIIENNGSRYDLMNAGIRDLGYAESLPAHRLELLSSLSQTNA